LRKGAELPFLLKKDIFTHDKGAPHLYRSDNIDYNDEERSRDNNTDKGGCMHR